MNDSAPAVEALPAANSAALAPHAPPKWAAVVSDRLIQLPHRQVKAREILFQAEAAAGTPLIRDYDSPNDVVLAEDVQVDLAEGNVFRTELQGTPGDGVPPDAPPKLAFVVDDDWEVTIRPNQTGQSMRDLFDIPPYALLLRDYKDPHDAVIADAERVNFADGPVFRTRVGTVTVTVNHKPVNVPLRDTVLGLKRAAIAQGVSIKLEFLVFIVEPNGLSAALSDDTVLTFHEGEEFRCVDADDNS